MKNTKKIKIADRNFNREFFSSFNIEIKFRHSPSWKMLTGKYWFDMISEPIITVTRPNYPSLDNSDLQADLQEIALSYWLSGFNRTKEDLEKILFTRLFLLHNPDSSLVREIVQ